MAVPSLTRLSQDRGPTSGGDLVRLTGANFSSRVAVWFGGAEARVVRVVKLAGATFADVRTPPHVPAIVDVAVRNLDAQGLRVDGERASLFTAYRYLRAPLTEEAGLTRAVRALLQLLKRDVLQNTAITVSVDYQPPSDDDGTTVALATLPSRVVSGPNVQENRFYRRYEPHESVISGEHGFEFVKHRPPFTADLRFTLTGGSSSTVELLNLMSASVTFLSRNRWLVMDRDPVDPSAGRVRWELHPDGDARTRLGGSDGVRVFTMGLVIRGFDVDEGLPLDRTPRVERPEVQTTTLSLGVFG